MEKVNFLPNGQWNLEKAYVNKVVPKGNCNCGAHSINSNTHYDWCDGLKKLPRYTKVADLPSGGAVWYDEDAHNTPINDGSGRKYEGNYKITHPSGRNIYGVVNPPNPSAPGSGYHFSYEVEEPYDSNHDEERFPNSGFPDDQITDDLLFNHINPAVDEVMRHNKDRVSKK